MISYNLKVYYPYIHNNILQDDQKQSVTVEFYINKSVYHEHTILYTNTYAGKYPFHQHFQETVISIS